MSVQGYRDLIINFAEIKGISQRLAAAIIIWTVEDYRLQLKGE